MIVGDLNSDLTTNAGMTSSNAGRKLHDVLQQFDYSVVNHQPTRVTSETSTLIDLVITSNPRHIKCTKTLELGISGHA